MKEQEIQNVILRVLSEYSGTSGGASEELPLEFPVEVSARHVHLTEEAIEVLFGKGAKLTPKRELSQTGQYLSEERVTLVSAKGQIQRVAVLGPARSANQVELSGTDCSQLGLHAPLRLSGDLKGAADVYIVGPKGMLLAKESVIIAKAHIHMTPEQALQAGVRDGQQVSVSLGSERRVTLEDVICRVSKSAALAMHIDRDEANACMLPGDAVSRMKLVVNREKSGDGAVAGTACGAETPKPASLTEAEKSASQSQDLFGGSPKENAKGVEKIYPLCGSKVLNESMALQIIKEGEKKIRIAKGVILTPSAKDALKSGMVSYEIA